MRRSCTGPIPSDSAQSNEEKKRLFKNCLAYLKIRCVLYTGDLNLTDMNEPRQINLIVNHPDNRHFKEGVCLRQGEKRRAERRWNVNLRSSRLRLPKPKVRVPATYSAANRLTYII